MTKFKEVLDTLTKKIYSGEYPPYSKLPEQEELAQLHGTSRMTIQKAMNHLKRDGLVVGKRGKGTFVNTSDYQQKVTEYIGLFNKYGGRYEVKSQIISYNARFPEDDEIVRLSIKESDPVYDIVRLRIVDGKPFELEYTIMPIKVIPDVTHTILETSIYRHITDTLHLTIGSATRRIRADKADKYDIRYLKAEPDDPILELEQIALLSDGRPFEFSQTRYHYTTGEIYYTSVQS